MNLNIRRNVNTNVIAFFVNIAITFIGYRMVVQQGGTAALGVWSALSAAIFIIRLGDVGMGSSAERYVAMVDATKQPFKARGYLDTALIINSILFIVLACIGWIILSSKIEWIIPNNRNLQFEALNLLPLMLLVFVISNVTNVITSGLRGLHLAYKVAYLSIFGTFLQMIVVILVVPKFGIVGLAIAQLVQNLIVGIISWYIFNRYMRKIESNINWLPYFFSKTLLSELFTFSIKAQIVNLVNGFFEPASKFLIGHSAGLSSLGVYEIALKLVQLPRNAIVAGVQSLTPTMTRLLNDDKQHAKSLYSSSVKKVFWYTLAILSIVSITSPITSYLIFNSVKFELCFMVIILTFGFLGNVFGAPAYILGFSSGKLRGNIFSVLISLTVLFLSFYIFRFLDFPYFEIYAISLSMIAGGISIKVINEKYLI